MSRQLVISGLLVILAFIAAFASLAFAPTEATSTVTVSEFQTMADLEQLLRMQLL